MLEFKPQAQISFRRRHCVELFEYEQLKDLVYVHYHDLVGLSRQEQGE
jgi:hypothetical protein